MTQDEFDWFEDWFQTLKGYLVAVSVRQTMLHADLHGLRDALFRLQGEPELSPRALLEQWKFSASEAVAKLEKDSQHALQCASEEIAKEKRQRRRARRKKVV